MKKRVFILAILLSLISAPLFAQTFIINEEQVGEVLDMFGAFSAGGYYHTADIHKIGGVDVGVRGVAAFIPSEYKDLIDGQDGPFKDVDYVAMPFLHASVGLPFNFEATARIFSYALGDKPTDGAVTLAGIGLKYGLLQLPALPKVTVMAAYTGFFVPDEYSFGTVGTSSFKAIVSKDFSLFTPYVGAGVDYTRLDLELSEDSKQSFDTSNFHGNIGVTVTLPMFYINADYTIGPFQGVNVGAGMTIR